MISCSQEKWGKSPIPQYSEFFGVTTKLYEDGQQLWAMNGDQIRTTLPPKILNITRLKAQRWETQKADAPPQSKSTSPFSVGSRQYQIRSDSANFDITQQLHVFNGHVEINNLDGVELKSNQLIWNRTKQLLQSPGSVAIKRKILTITGDSMVVDINESRMDVSGNVTTLLHSK
jgi:LPS export ABC transporter protein LptC